MSEFRYFSNTPATALFFFYREMQHRNGVPSIGNFMAGTIEWKKYLPFLTLSEPNLILYWILYIKSDGVGWQMRELSARHTRNYVYASNSHLKVCEAARWWQVLFELLWAVMTWSKVAFGAARCIKGVAEHETSLMRALQGGITGGILVVVHLGARPVEWSEEVGHESVTALP